MTKFWMMGAAVIAVSVTVAAWGWRPVRASDNLLEKAQTEFAIKARDALIQRRMAQASQTPVAAPAAGPALVAAAAPAAVPPPAAADEPISSPESPYVVASLEPVAAPVIAKPAAPVVAATPETPTALDSQDTPVAAPKLSAAPELPAVPAVEDKPATPTVEEKKPAEPQMASLPEAPAAEKPVTPKPAIAWTTAPELARVASPIADATPREPVKAAHKMRRARNEPKTNVAERRYDRDTSGYSTPYNLGALRARSPELAAAIARYM